MAVPLARRMLWHQPIRAAAAVAGLAMSATLLFFLGGLRRGVLSSAEAYSGQAAVDVWIARRGTENLIRSSSFLPAELAAHIETDSAVADAAAILRVFLRVEGPRGHATLLAIGYEPAGALGGPPRLVAGRAPIDAREIVLDRGAAHRLGVAPGDRVRLNGVDASVVGLSTDTNILATQMLFGHRADVAALSGAGSQASFVLVRLRPGEDVERFARTWSSRDTSLVAFARSEFVANNRVEVNAGFDAVFRVLRALGALVAAAVIALILYGRVLESRMQFAVLLALGARARLLTRVVLTQTLALTGQGLVWAGLLTIAFGSGAERWVPEISFALEAADLVRSVTLVWVAALAGAALPLAQIRAIEPEEVFRS